MVAEMNLKVREHLMGRTGPVTAGLAVFGAAIFLLSQVSLAAGEGYNFTGLWNNQRGSTLEVVPEGNRIIGTFTTAVVKTKTCIGYGAPVIGFTNDNALSISMTLEGCGSPVTIGQTGILMTGEDGKEKIKTQALVQYNGTENWNSQILVADYYQRVK
ncbi:avidin/streptavidin family protein [Sansalvadorimonas sp. 2012CJ34-2]|uniref:Avidin/streptavidin family protein n=1 Tax=Parendozoicomonas callyspongiae TaxID=2942213 RepID=A0ABT0PGA8_9GAMM|nr:avidin/streptavidin family protein [Sansalvadorimonas sp. 2012CJ34-2]MCL6270355.1 avidin/streptavidin family protein [Sansalvadorimonas sp. 2012CJ34-2]